MGIKVVRGEAVCGIAVGEWDTVGRGEKELLGDDLGDPEEEIDFEKEGEIEGSSGEGVVDE